MKEKFLAGCLRSSGSKFKGYIGSIPITKEYKTKGWVITTLVDNYMFFTGRESYKKSGIWNTVDRIEARKVIDKLVKEEVITISDRVPYCNGKLSKLLTSADEECRILGINLLINGALETKETETSENIQEENNESSKIVG